MLDFGEEVNLKNRLPFDGSLYYWGCILAPDKSHKINAKLLNEVSWKNDEAVIYGKHIITKRQYAWYADHPYEYTYSGVSRKAQPWNPLIGSLRDLVQSKTGKPYNSCLLNLYPNGETGMAWHSDDEKDLITNGSIASLSLGASRKFSMKHRANKHKIDFILNAGDLLEMCDETQSYWMHAIQKTKKVTTPRINLTFRQMVK